MMTDFDKALLEAIERLEDAACERAFTLDWRQTKSEHGATFDGLKSFAFQYGTVTRTDLEMALERLKEQGLVTEPRANVFKVVKR